MLQSPPVLSLGGMCFVRKLLVEWVGGACGPFDYTATTPAIVQHILADDFKELLTPSHFNVCHSDDGKVRMQHEFYKNMALTAIQHIIGRHHMALMDLQHIVGRHHLLQGDFSELDGIPPMFLDVIPPMFKHPGTKGIEGLIDDLRRRAQRVHEFLCEDSWKVMVWGVAIPRNGYNEATSRGIDPFDIVKKQVSELFEDLNSRTKALHLLSSALWTRCLLTKI